MENQYEHIVIDPLLFSALMKLGDSSQRVRVQPDSEGERGGMQEIIRLSKDQKHNGIVVHTRQSNLARKIALDELTNDDDWRILLEILDEEFTEIRIGQYLRRQSHLQEEPMLKVYFDLAPELQEAQKQVLMYYLPYLDQIKNDLACMQACFQTIFNYPVKLLLGPPKQIDVTGTTVGQSILGMNAKVGGRGSSTKVCLCLQFGPLASENLESLVHGSSSRKFLESVLCPLFIPHHWDWKIELLAEKSTGFNQNIPEKYQAGRLGINCICQ